MAKAGCVENGDDSGTLDGEQDREISEILDQLGILVGRARLAGCNIHHIPLTPSNN